MDKEEAVHCREAAAMMMMMSLAIPSSSAVLLYLEGKGNLPGTLTLTLTRSPHYRTLCRGRSERPFAVAVPLPTTKQISRISCSKSNDNISQQTLNKKQWTIFQSWDVPWDWKITLYVMMPYLLSIALTGLFGSTVLTGVSQPSYESVQPHLQNTDELATRFFLDQLLKTAVKLFVLYVFVSPYRPFQDNVFSYRWSEPFNLRHGWILWGGGGLIIASSAVFLIKALVSSSSASQLQNQVDSLMRLLPFIGASNTSTICLLGILGVLAPLCEETLYRGFFMTSLTKWLPVHVSVVVSSAVFTLAHQSPGKSLEIFIFGTILGLVYAQTRNLLAPIAMHACWNLAVVLVLTYLQVQGYEIEKYVL